MWWCSTGGATTESKSVYTRFPLTFSSGWGIDEKNWKCQIFAYLVQETFLLCLIWQMLENGVLSQLHSWKQHSKSFLFRLGFTLFVGKPDGNQRFCTDYRQMNILTRPYLYPLPRNEDCVDQVVWANFVSKFDLLKGYWQVPVGSTHGINTLSDICALSEFGICQTFIVNCDLFGHGCWDGKSVTCTC